MDVIVLSSVVDPELFIPDQDPATNFLSSGWFIPDPDPATNF